MPLPVTGQDTNPAPVDSGRAFVTAEPGSPSYWLQAGAAALQRGDAAEAIQSLTKAVALAPDAGEHHHSLGVAFLIAGDYPAAILSFTRALELDPNPSTCNHLCRTYHALADTLFEHGRYTEASEAYSHVVRLNPASSDGYNNLGVAQGWLGEMAACLRSLRQSVALDPHNAVAGSNLLLAMHYGSDIEPAAILEAHRDWAARVVPPLLSNPRRPRVYGPRLRVGFVSQDFCGHSVAAFFEPVLRWNDAVRIDVTCYSHTPRADAVTERLRDLSPSWREIGDLTDEQAARQIEADDIDILVDLAGHTAGNRLGIFSFHPASVQAAYLGYPATTGHPAIEYRITDSQADPAGMTEHLHTETLIRLDPSFLCYQPPRNAPHAGPLPARSTDSITFGCFNHLPKLSDGTLELWSHLLAAIPNSTLLLKCRSFSDQKVMQSFTVRVAGFGIHSSRLRLHAFSPAFTSHLDLYNSVDIALDPFPYHGTTTTWEALWMGVPVVTLEGRTHASRVGVSLLRSTGLDELVAQSTGDYVAVAQRLADDVGRLEHFRRTLRGRLLDSPLTGGSAFAARLATAFHHMAAGS